MVCVYPFYFYLYLPSLLPFLFSHEKKKKKSSTIVSLLRGSGVVGGVEGGGVARFRGSEGFVLKSSGILIHVVNVLNIPQSVHVSAVSL